MQTQGEKLKSFLDSQRINKAALARDLKMSKQNLFQLFKSKQLTPDTIKSLEKVLKIKWEQVEGVNIDHHPKEGKTIDINKESLEVSIENLTIMNVASIKIIDRLVALLEQRAGVKTIEPILPEPGDPYTAQIPRVKKKSSH